MAIKKVQAFADRQQTNAESQPSSMELEEESKTAAIQETILKKTNGRLSASSLAFWEEARSSSQRRHVISGIPPPPPPSEDTRRMEQVHLRKIGLRNSGSHAELTGGSSLSLKENSKIGRGDCFSECEDSNTRL